MQHYNICEGFCQLFRDMECSSMNNLLQEVDYGMLVGGFLSECGWLSNAIEVLSKVFEKGK